LAPKRRPIPDCSRRGPRWNEVAAAIERLRKRDRRLTGSAATDLAELEVALGLAGFL